METVHGVAVTIAVLGFAVGVTVGWIARYIHNGMNNKTTNDHVAKNLARIQTENQSLLLANARLEATLTSERTSSMRERESAAEDQIRMSEVFRSVGTEILRDAMEQTEARSMSAIKTTHDSIEDVLGPVLKATASLDVSLKEIENERRGSYERLTTTVESLGRTERDLTVKISDLRSTTSGLAQALRNPSARGTWGEMHLRRIVELAGMVEHCDFSEQETLSSSEGVGRPDLTVMISENQRLFVDAKAPLSAYLEAAEATDERVRTESIRRHVSALRLHMRTLASRGYARKDQRSGEMVIMYVPSEGALSAAISADREVLEDALASGIVLCGPMQLIALLRIFGNGWRQQKFEKSAARVVALATEFVERAGIFGNHMTDLQKGLVSVIKSYNAVAGSAESRMLVTARHIATIGGTKAVSLPELRFIEEAPRTLAAPEFTGSGT